MSLIANSHVDITLKLQLLFIKNKKKKRETSVLSYANSTHLKKGSDHHHADNILKRGGLLKTGSPHSNLAKILSASTVVLNWLLSFLATSIREIFRISSLRSL